MSTIAMSGLYERTFSSRSSAVPLWPDDLESLALEQARDALAQQHRVVGEDDADRRLWLAPDQGARRRRDGVSPTKANAPDRRRVLSGAVRAAPRSPSRQLGLRDEAERGAARDQRPEIGAVEARGQDHLGRRLECAKPLCDLEPVEVGQLHVDERQIGRVLLRRPQPFDAVSGFGHDDETAPLEQLSRRCAEGAVVVDDEHARGTWADRACRGHARQCG